LEKKSSVELHALFHAIGLLGANTALDLLRSYLFRKPWFGRKSANLLRPYAAYAVAMLPTPEGQALWSEAEQSRDGAIREACETARRMIAVMRSQSYAAD
jgi:hypothetical protein